MRPVLPVRLLRAKAAVAAVAAALLLLGMPSAHAQASGPPKMTDGFGLTQVGAATGTATNFVITVTTPEVTGEHHIRILLPGDYATNPSKRYPVFYFLHGASDDPVNPNLAYPALTAAKSMITVIPDGGLRGWYTNWLDQETVVGAQNWENFHINQVIPFIDANLRTIAAKKGRAVAGLSMGGFGSMHYAQAHPELFSQVGSFSGAVDLSIDHAVMRAAVVATLTNIGAALCGSSNPTCSLDFGPTVSSDAIFGTPYPVLNLDWRWNEADPSSHMDRLAGMGISLYTGDGAGDPANPEFWVRSASQHAKDHLDALGYPYHYVDYGNGAGWGSCDGGHDYACWAQDLVDFVPRMEAAFASA
ncbi:S-formylglutathione hydrolase FrmB [Streptomyces olivoverticillatus]|uniref:S-formylglutathione hydrolase FrmB n=1 Tax=Streptomyces olivoverticillatus TaxID=66427 RepID=A0A7W7LT26_9ACTN|nr:alpha/beta hydrolase family protein [Streptomyces olivoverticillatus]MBB4895945.1 S-formylglutathione hydrolase FrmB [Streptomyces olivoverticillatus]